MPHSIIRGLTLGVMVLYLMWMIYTLLTKTRAIDGHALLVIILLPVLSAVIGTAAIERPPHPDYEPHDPPDR